MSCYNTQTEAFSHKVPNFGGKWYYCHNGTVHSNPILAKSGAAVIQSLRRLREIEAELLEMKNQ